MKRLAVLWLCACSSLFAQETLTIETVSADRKLWPREVTVSIAHDVPIVVNGKSSGSMKAAAGRTYPVKSISATGIVVDALGSPLTFAASDTDVLPRAEQLNAKREALAAAATPIPTPVATPVKSAATPSAPAENLISKALSGDLVALDGRKLKNFDASALAGKTYFAIYRSASWCGPCRQFTPDLVSWYKSKKSSHDKFAVIFVSEDRSEEDMAGYMSDDKMPWPALEFNKRSKRLPITGLGGRGIPDLVIMDSDGKVISRSYEGGNYVGPRKVLKDLDNLLKGS